MADVTAACRRKLSTEGSGSASSPLTPPAYPSDALDIANGVCPNGVCQAGYGWQDGIDNDGNSFADDFFGWDFDENDNLPQPPAMTMTNYPPHGTAVAGIAAGAGNNAIANPGVAWHNRLMLVKGVIVSNPAGPNSNPLPIPDRLKRDSYVRAMVYAHSNGAQVINASVGSSISSESGEYPGCVKRGIHFVPDDKFKPGVQKLAQEWELNLGALKERAVLVVAVNDCGDEDADRAGGFFYPGGFVRARPDIGTTFVHTTMITVAAMSFWDDLNNVPQTFPQRSSFTMIGKDSVLIGAPGDNWRTLDARQYPATGKTAITTNCVDSGDTLTTVHRCRGTSFAAPVVTGAAALTFANQPSLSAAAVKQRILDNATNNELGVAPNFIQGSRLLNIEAAVGM